MIMSDDENTDKCPCKKGYKATLLKCKKCACWWHGRCVGLTGLTSGELTKLKEWHCPYCYLLPEAAKRDFTLESLHKEVAALKSNLNDKFNNVIDQVEDKCEDQTKKWSDLFKQNNSTQQLQEVVTQVVEKSKQKMDFDHVERERRKNNIVIREVKESEATDNEQRKADDKLKASIILNIDEANIEQVMRPTKPPHRRNSDSNANTNRPLIVTLKTPELACDLHGHDRGKRVLNPDDEEMWLWINPDLIEADRTANYLARKERRERLSNRSGRVAPSTGVVTRRGSFLSSQILGDNQGR